MQEGAVCSLNICKVYIVLMYLSTWWLSNTVIEEVLCILHTPLNFNFTEIISHSPFWAGCLHLCQRESPDLECEHSRKKVFLSMLLDGVQVCRTLSLRQTGLLVFLYSFCFFPFYSPTPIGTTLTQPWITPFSHSFSNSSDIHSNQARARTSSTKRSAHESPWKDLTFYILLISVCGCLHRKREVGKLWWTGPCSSTIILVQSLHFWFHSKSTCLVGLSWLFRNTGALASFCLLNNVNSVS